LKETAMQKGLETQSLMRSVIKRPMVKEKLTGFGLQNC
jgi:hypothetical protein